MRRTLVILAAFAILSGGSVHADMWCAGARGQLDHPCSDSLPDASVAKAIREHRNAWMDLPGVWSVDPVGLANGHDGIRVHVDERFGKSPRSKIPSSVDGIPIVIVPDEMPCACGAVKSFSSPSGNKEGDDSSNASTQQREKEAYSIVVENYGARWNALPGVVGIGPAKCRDDGCDFSSIGITVQAQLMNTVRGDIPSSVNGVPIVLIPDNDPYP
jgi:hypothetical protein